MLLVAERSPKTRLTRLSRWLFSVAAAGPLAAIGEAEAAEAKMATRTGVKRILMV